jgi:arsenate reductase (thioredoxin)
MKKVLFVCMLNAARSQAAEAFFKQFIKGTALGKEWSAESAGMMSKQDLNPYVLAILKEKGISTEGQYSKKIDFSKIRDYDKIISFVPFPKAGLHDETKAKIKLWIIADPLGRPFEETRDIVNMIEEKVKELVSNLKAE